MRSNLPVIVMEKCQACQRCGNPCLYGGPFYFVETPRMTREQKLRFHLEMIIWEELPPETPYNAADIDQMVLAATSDQKQRAYQRALTTSPILLDDERTLD